MRALQGRYGVDHSEILNWEFEQANKPRSDHMNLLVYKQAAENMIDTTKQYKGPSVHKTNANVLFERLREKEEIEEGQEKPSNAITYNEWVRRKDAERRMKIRLLKEAK
jgi:hypothetical protein